MVNAKNAKKKLNSVVNKVKKENPNANWKNLITGILIIVIAGLFSVWYLSNNAQQADLITDVANGDEELIFEENVTGTGSSVEQTVADGERTTVQRGEGLWHVARRVCGDGESYRYMAEANNLNVRWANLSEGQELIVQCGPQE